MGLPFVSRLRLFVAVVFVGAALTASLRAQVAATRTVLTPSAASVAQGAPVVLTAAVTGLPASRGGQVAFCDTTQINVCSAASANLLGLAQLTTASQARLKLRLGAGTHSLVARFLGTTTAATSSSSLVRVAVSAATTHLATSVSLTPQGTFTESVYTLQSTVSTPPGQPFPGGTVAITAATPSGKFPVVSQSVTSGSPASDALERGTRVVSGSGRVLADFNEDGVPDLALTDTTEASVSFSAGNGDGTFVSPTAANKVPGLCATSCVALATADWNSDGHADLVTLEKLTNNYQLHFATGRGDGTFQSSSPIDVALTVGTGMASLVVADYNGDGLPDLLVYVGSTATPALAVALQRVDGSFQLSYPTTFASPNLLPSNPLIYAADYNGDGKADFVCTSYVQGSQQPIFSTYLSKGDGNFAASIIPMPDTLAGFTPGLIALGDFNGDGIADLALLASSGSGSYGQALNGDGHGGFSPGRIFGFTYDAGGEGIYSLDTLDVNGDGLSDILLVGTVPDVSSNALKPQILIQPTNGTSDTILSVFAPGEQVPMSPSLNGDLNGDGRPDILYSQAGGLVLLNRSGYQQASVTINNVQMPAGTTLPLTAAFTTANSNYLPSISPTIAVTGQTVDPTVTLSVSPQSVAAGQAVTLSATITPSTTPDGYSENGQVVTYSGGPAAGPGIKLSATVTNGVARLTTTGLPAGSYAIFAQLADNLPFLSATGSSQITVTPAGPQQGSLAGTYAFRSRLSATIAGVAQDGAVVGVLKADGAGGLTGEEDINAPSLSVAQSAITGSYSVLNPDGGTLHVRNAQGLLLDFFMTLGDFDTKGVAHTLTLLPYGPQGIGGEGTAELVTSTNPTLNSAGFTLALEGQTGCQPAACQSAGHASGAVSLLGSVVVSPAGFTINGYPGYSGSGSVVENSAGTVAATLNFAAQLGGPDPSGRYSFTVQSSGLPSDSPKTFVGYAVGSNKLYLLSTDPHGSSTLLSGFLQQQ
ncbi:FG-GAP-like repeat-containing protein [Acidipila sp. EB88]|uniref:FG-GAP-like repeat-containing protein n=1 Tax=Acidipila sp. EB88 TaxID=2305226 RepID=UPI000F5FD34E|nr:FG-GAP-like repeat-containing protein [Acidipila sp. EB88]RRA49599.1 hypothetical protein D1Y84_16310 [Acidipila sp. EB88]